MDRDPLRPGDHGNAASHDRDRHRLDPPRHTADLDRRDEPDGGMSSGAMGAVAAATLGAVAAAGIGLYAARKARRDDSIRGDAPGHVLTDATELLGYTVTIRRSRSELYAFYRDVSNLTKFMSEVRSIEPIDAVTSKWTMRGPLGTSKSFTSRIIADVPDEKISWSSDEASAGHAGTVTFTDAPGDRGTRVRIEEHAPGGMLSRASATLTGRPPQTVLRHDLKRFKMLMEAGEIAVSKAEEQ